MQPSADQKIITVSGLYSGIGKTELSQHIVSLMPGCAAIKVTINDQVTEVLDDEASIMIAGKDTWRLKTSGAAQVVWVRAQEEHLGEALNDARGRVRVNSRLLIEGNSVLGHISPALAVFMCDERICDDKPLKPSRVFALQKADAVIHNLRRDCVAEQALVQEKIREINPSAEVYALEVTDKQQATMLLTGLLLAHGFLPAPPFFNF
jgi:Ni2+-binding GTPase involved in maturation of urease and hydrogenase